MKILMIDDEVKLREKVNKYLTLKGYQVLEAGSGEEGLAVLSEQEVELILLDLRMPGMDGLTCLEEIKASGWAGEVIMISAHGEIPDAVKAMKLGASDYLTKPFRLDQLLGKVQLLEEKQRQRALSQEAGERGVFGSEEKRGQLGGLWPSGEQPERSGSAVQFESGQEGVGSREISGFIFASQEMQEILEAIRRVAPSDVPVLLLGETGVGKEVVAQSVHQLSGRTGEFIAINCGAIPENLMESELFGHEKGAFSGAHQRKLGKLELAQGGTIFLDEIGELPKGMQVKLLRVLQEKELERVGGTQRIPLDLRIVAATNRDLQVEMVAGRFREDLYYRLNVISLKIRPLRERKDDILPLAEQFIREMNQRLGKGVGRLSEVARDQLLSYNYPGNVRELKNIIERSMVLSTGDDLEVYLETGSGGELGTTNNLTGARGTVGDDADLAKVARGPQSQFFLTDDLTLEELEALRIREALAKHEGNRTRAAKELGVSRRTIINKIKQFQLDV